MSEDTLTYESLLRMIEALGPRPPRPVLIVAKWLRGTNGLRREKDGREEWRVTPAAFAVLERQAVRAEWDYPGTLTGIPVEYEDRPPADLIAAMRSQMEAWAAPPPQGESR